MIRPSALEAVVAAIVRLGERQFIKIYIERSGELYRWSIAHRGGPYPLLREVARYLELPHDEVLMEAASVREWSVVAPVEEKVQVDGWAFIEPTADAEQVLASIRSAVSAKPRSGSGAPDSGP